MEVTRHHSLDERQRKEIGETLVSALSTASIITEQFVGHPEALGVYWRAQPETMVKSAQLYSVDDLCAVAVFIPGASNPAALPASVTCSIGEATMAHFVQSVGEAAACGRISMRAWRKATVSELIQEQGLDETDVDELSVIAVRPDRQGLGLGGALLSHILQARDQS